MTASDSNSRGHRAVRTNKLEWLVLAVALIAVVAAAGWSGKTTPPAFSTTQVKTEYGDTLWSLASAHPIEGLTTAQTAAVIAEVNSVSAHALAVGTTVRVPASASADSYAMR